MKRFCWKCIIIGAAIVVVNFLHDRVTVPPLEMPGMAAAVDRSMAPVTEFGMETMGSTIMTPLVMFGHKSVRRAIVVPLEVFVLETRLGANKITPGKMAVATPAEVAPVDRIIGSLKTVAAIQVAISASFARSPGISG